MLGQTIVLNLKKACFMYRKIFKAEKTEDLQIKLPDEYLHKEVEVIAFEVAEEKLQVKRKDVDEAIAFFNAISVDMSDFKFDRNEANER
jgi:hypothetical protein